MAIFFGGGSNNHLNSRSRCCDISFSILWLNIFERMVAVFYGAWGVQKWMQHNERDHDFDHPIINMCTQPTSDDLLISITTDKKFNQAKQIFAITGGFTDATGVLEDLCSAVCDHAGPLFFRMWLLWRRSSYLSWKIQPTLLPPPLVFYCQLLEWSMSIIGMKTGGRWRLPIHYMQSL